LEPARLVELVVSPRLIHEVRNRLAQRLEERYGIILEGHLLEPRGINATIDAADLEGFAVRMRAARSARLPRRCWAPWAGVDLIRTVPARFS
jgi:hypothetical protein